MHSVSQDDIKNVDASGYALIVITASTNGVNFGDTYSDSAVPILYLETASAAAHGLGSRLHYDTTSIEVTAPSHSVAAGTAGVVEVCDSEEELEGLELLDSGIQILSHVQDSSSSVFFVYEKGALVGGAALPGARAGTGLIKAECLTEATFAYIEASVIWLVTH